MTQPSSCLHEDAKKTMELAHAGQTRWDGRPYSVHPEKVVQILKQFGVRDEEILSAGYLHDVIEDTKVSLDELEGAYGSRVAHLVQELTFKDSKDDDNLYSQQCMNLSKTAKLIKIADILANITDDGKKSDHFIRKRINGLKMLLGDDS